MQITNQQTSVYVWVLRFDVFYPSGTQEQNQNRVKAAKKIVGINCVTEVKTENSLLCIHIETPIQNGTIQQCQKKLDAMRKSFGRNQVKNWNALTPAKTIAKLR